MEADNIGDDAIESAVEQAELEWEEIRSIETALIQQLTEADLEFRHLVEAYNQARDLDEDLDDSLVQSIEGDDGVLTEYDKFIDPYLREDNTWNKKQIVYDIADNAEGENEWHRAMYGHLDGIIDVVNDLHEDVREFMIDHGYEPETPEPGSTKVDEETLAQYINEEEIARYIDVETEVNVDESQIAASLNEETIGRNVEINEEEIARHINRLEYPSGTEPETTPTTTPEPTPEPGNGGDGDDTYDEDEYDKPSDTLEWLGGVAFGDYGLGDFTLGLKGERRGP